jgi:hypothetical protein
MGKDNNTNPSDMFLPLVTNGRMSLHVIPVELSASRIFMIELEELPSLGMTFQRIFIG